MEDKKITETTTEEQSQKEESSVAVDWADIASQELSDYIEEQGIQIRY